MSVVLCIRHSSSSGASRQHSQSRENINFPEDEVVGRLEGGMEEIMGSSSPGKISPVNINNYYSHTSESETKGLVVHFKTKQIRTWCFCTNG